MRELPVVARVAEGGHTLVVLLPGGRRTALSPGIQREESTAEDLLAAARPLTMTERVVTAHGAAWLVQASGPVWSGGAAADSCGLVFTALDGTMRRVSRAGLLPGSLPGDAELGELLEQALAAQNGEAGQGIGR